MTKKENSVPTFESKGYTGTCEISLEDGCLFGRVLHIADLITYEGENVAELKMEFEKAVAEYLAFCKSVGKSPEKPYSGSFNVRCGPELHKSLAHQALLHGVSLNEELCTILRAHFDGAHQKTENHYHIIVEGAPVRHASAAASSSEFVQIDSPDLYVKSEAIATRVPRRAAH